MSQQKNVLFGLIMTLAVCSSFCLDIKKVLEQHLTVPTDKVLASSVLLTFPPGDEGTPPHYHSGPVVGYVLKGSFLFQVNDEPPRIIEAGGSFYEYDRATHLWGANASDNSTCEVLVTVFGRPEEPILTLVNDAKRSSRADALTQAQSQV